MARDHARIFVRIWNDVDFRALPSAAQHMYLTLMSQERLSYCGVLDYIPSRYATLSADGSSESVEQAVKLLEAERYVVVDRDTHELVIRTFVRHDGLLKVPNMVKAMTGDYSRVLSFDLRRVIETELARARVDQPKLPGWKVIREVSPELHAKVMGKGSA